MTSVGDYDVSTLLQCEEEFTVFDGWLTPKCLVTFDEEGKIRTESSTLEQLQLITDPAVIVAIVGPYRTGKSYLMNRLARSRSDRGFSVGSTVQAHTKGIWIWCIHHPTRPGHCFVLLDTEGLGDVEKVDEEDDVRIFTLAVLLSSTLVYNCMNSINKTAIDGLHLASEATELIKIDSEDEESDSSFDAYFPSFVMVVRDFELELEVNGQLVSEDEYLEHALKLKPGSGRAVSDYNTPRECIRNYFTQRKCFTFRKPVRNSELLKHLNDLPDNKLSAEFVQKRDNFLAHILSHSPVKTINSQRVTGRALASLTASYVASIASGKICVESAVQQMVREEAKKATDESYCLYLQLMEMKVPMFPTDTVEELKTAHHEAVQQATELFNSRCVADCDIKYTEELRVKLDEAYQNECRQNESKSRERCEQLLERLYRDIDGKMINRYMVAHGYVDYLADVEQMREQYGREQHKGVMAHDVLDEFMAKQRATSERLLQADMQMQQELANLVDEINRKEDAEIQQLELEQSQLRMEEMMEERRLNFEAQIAKMKAQHEEDMRQADEEERVRLEQSLRDQKRRLEAELEDQMRPLREQFEREVAKIRSRQP